MSGNGGIIGSVDKSLDVGIASNRVFIVNDLAGHRITTPIPLIAAAQTFSGSWADLGPEISVDGNTRISLWIKVTMNDGYDLSFRMLAKHTSGGSEEYLLPILKTNTSATPYNLTAEGDYIELNVDSDQLMILTWDIANTIPYIQIQCIEGGTSDHHATVDTAYITYGWAS